MAPIKRKGNVAEDATTQKRARVGAEDRKKDNKKQKTSTSDDSKSTNAAPKPTEISVLRDDEPSFPRGGASVLTPLERKQIQIEATKDVLFEQKGSKKSSGAPGNEDEDEDEDEDADMGEADDSAAAKKPRKQRKSKAKKKADKEESDKKSVRIEGLNFKVCLKTYDALLIRAFLD